MTGRERGVMSLTYCVAVVGCGQLGGRLAKELCRFFNSLEENVLKRIALFDNAIVDESDIKMQEFLSDDIGWHKSAVLASVYSEAFSNIKIKGFGEVSDVGQFRSQIGLTNIYNTSEHITLIFDMSGCGKRVSRVIRAFFNGYPNCIVFTPCKNTLHTAIKLAGTVIEAPVASSRRKEYTVTEAMRVCRLCLAKTAMMVTDGKLPNTELQLANDGVGVGFLKDQMSGGKPTTVQFSKKNEKLLCVTVGCGGTGGNFIKEFVHTQMAGNENVSLLMIDGDRVEEKNLSRQPFGESDILQNKARCLKQDLFAEFPQLEGRLFDFPFYVDDVSDLITALELTGNNGKILLIGAVDNHRARQVMEQFYDVSEDCIYIDAANEWSNGEVVVSVKKSGKEYSPRRSFYYPEVLTDKSPSASELSCGVVNQSFPQHFCTNLASAQGVLGAIEPIVRTGRVRGGIFYFDAFREYARFQEVWINNQQCS